MLRRVAIVARLSFFAGWESLFLAINTFNVREGGGKETVRYIRECNVLTIKREYMKRMITLSCLMLLCALAGSAQKFALVDMEYILKNIPAYEMTNEQLSQVSKKWQNEVEALQQEAQNMYKTYQSDLVFLSAEMKTKREEEIVKKEQEAQDLKRKYFGPEGELYKKRESLMKPIQDEIYNAVKEISEDKGYQIVWDRASAMSIIFASPRIDISNEVLNKLGYSK